MIHYLVAIYYRIIIIINDLFNTSIYKKIKNEYQAIQLGKKHNYVSGSNVYLGKYLNEKVIIKGFDIFNLYKNEINILNILNQSNFVPGILKVSKKYFIEEYVDGQTFDEYLKENMVNDKILKQIIEYLDYLYSYKIVHRDIRPENIIINRENIKVIDYGCAIKVDNKLFKFPLRVEKTLGEKYKNHEYWDDASSFYNILKPYVKDDNEFLLEIKKREKRLIYERES